MSTVLTVYSASAFKEYLLPAVDNADFTLALSGELFGLGRDVELNLEILDGLWRVVPGKDVRISLGDDKTAYQGSPLKSGDLLILSLAGGERISAVVRQVQDVFSVYEKFDVSNITSLTIGKNPENIFSYDFRGLVSREHAVLFKAQDGLRIEDRSSNGTFVNGRRISGQKVLSFGDCIDIFGFRIVCLGNVIAINTGTDNLNIRGEYLRPYQDKGNRTPDKLPEKTEKKLFHRAPRNIPKIETEPVEIDPAPGPREGNTQPAIMTIGPSLTMALPMLAGCFLSIYGSQTSGMGGGVFMYTGIVTAIGSAILGAFWAFNNMRYAKKRTREEEENRVRRYNDYLIRTSQQIKEKYDNNAASLLALYPESGHLTRYDRNSGHLWNRNFRHDDFLVQRLGLGDVLFQVPISVPKERFSLVEDMLAVRPAQIKDNYKYIHNVPVCVDLKRHRLLGIVGGPRRAGCYPVVYNLVAGIAANNCYTDVKTVFIYDQSLDAGHDAWEFARWLPHTWSEDKKVRYVASDSKEAGDVIYEITQVLRMRGEQKQGAFAEEAIYRPYYILFVENEKMLEGELISKYVFDVRENYGLSTIILSEDYNGLPNDCEYIIENTQGYRGMYDVTDGLDERISITFDSVSQNQLEDFARRLCDIEVREEEQAGEIPESLTFLEMYKVNHPRELRVLERWKKNRTYESMRALVGQRSGGADCYLDVHEKYHGPHGLVAGTTGSGKSETLQTYMLSLALNYSPDDVGFFIIDYKGGGMANLFEGLPHMLGQISNLSGNQVRRAMVSIKSENRRRQRIFNEYGVNNINLYTRLYKSHEATIPVPHMFIIIDEFAELKREEPEFMKELISVAQVGRSLGVHLILATQKPSGTVDDNIWSNSKFRLCLRVQDKQDSNDMLHRPDAAYLTQAGRSYLQVGNDELFELFQSAYSGAAYDEESGDPGAEVAVMIERGGRASIVGSALRVRPKDSESKEATQLDAVRDYLAKVAAENGYNRDLRLWLPVLGEEIYLSSLAGFGEYAFRDGIWHKDLDSRNLKLGVPVGLYDDPENQAQDPLVIDILEGGNHAVIGSVATGKSTFLSTYIYSLINLYSPKAVNVYAIDFSGKMMAPFESAPHVGGVMFEEDTEKIAKFFNMIGAILSERKKLFKGGSYTQYVRANGLKYPVILLAIDNMGAFREKSGGKYDDAIFTILKEGIGCGIYVMATGAGFSMNEIPNRFSDGFRTVMALELKDKYAYSDVLHTMQIDVLPETNVKGRGLVKIGDRVLEFQTALSLPSEDDYQRGELIGEVTKKMAESYTGPKARPIPEIPAKPLWSEYALLPEVCAMQKDGHTVPFGYDAASAAAYGIDLSKIYVYLISGKARTGKTNALRVIMASLHAMDTDLTVIDFEGDLKNNAQLLGARYVDSARALEDTLRDFIPELTARNEYARGLSGQGISPEEKFLKMQQFKKMAFIVGDMAAFLKTADNPGGGMESMTPFLANLFDKGDLHNIYWFIGFNPESRAEIAILETFRHATRDGRGAHLGGKVEDQQVLSFEHLQYNDRVKSTKAGIALLPTHDYDSTNAVVIPLYDEK